MKIKLIGIALTALPLLALSNVANASDFGCEALLCFAGGKNVGECQPTIKKVLKDLAKGKSFPHCDLVGSSGSSGDNVQVKHYTTTQRSPICKDGVTRGKRTFIGYQCPTIEINIKPDFALDPKHQQQFFNYSK